MTMKHTPLYARVAAVRAAGIESGPIEYVAAK